MPQTVGTSFLGIQLSEAAFIPPDSVGDVGPTQLLVGANGRIKSFSKLGTPGQLNTTTDSFFASVGGTVNGTVDPHIRFDRLSQRWFVTMIDLAAVNHILIAVSSGPTITNTSSFGFFSFQHDQVGPTPNPDTGFLADFDTLGVDRFALYVGVNVFDGDTFTGTTGFVINKANLLSNVLTVTAFRQLAGSTCSASGPFSPQGVQNDDPQVTEGYFIGNDVCLFGRLALRRVVNPGGAPSISGNLFVTVPSTAYPIDQAQPSAGCGGPCPALDAFDDRLFAAAIHTNKITGAKTLWTAHNIEVNSSGVGQEFGGRNGSRWYEIGNLAATPTLVQSGTLFDPAVSNPFGYWIPSVAMSGQGHMAIATSRASATGGTGPASGHASISAAGRLRADGPGSTRAPTLVTDSDSPYDTFFAGTERWGDFSQTVVDPTDNQTIWTFQEYANAVDSWGVRVIQLKAPPPAMPASASPPTVLTGQSSVNVTITGTSVSGSEFFDPGPDAGGPGFPNHIAASVSGGVIVNSVTFNSPTQVTLNISTVAATGGAQNVTITNPDGQSTTGTILTILPMLSINDVMVTEGNSGTVTAGFTVSLSSSSSQTITVNYATADGTAMAGMDYAAGGGTITFPPGVVTRPLNVTVLGDILDESNETFFVNLSSPSGAVISDGQGVGTIVDDDTSMVSVSDTSLLEGVGGTTTAAFTVSLSTPSAQTVTVPYSTADGTANAGSDYTATSGTVTFASGEVSQPVLVMVSGDTAVEPNETFFVNLGPPTNATLADGQGVGTIVNDDPPGPSAFAEFLMLGQVHQTSVSNVAPTRWFKVRLVAGRSYAASAWAPTTDVSESPVSLDVAWFLDDGVTAAGGVNAVEREPTPDASDHNGDAESIIPTAADCAVPSGCTYRVRLQATGATTVVDVRLMIVETTMVSPYWQVATAAGYEAAPQIRNNTSSSVPVTFTAYGNTGTVVCSNAVTLPANGMTTFGISGAAPGCGIASGFGSAQIAFHGPPGSITANITTFSALSGLSFDAPFTPRNTATSLRPN